MTVNSSYSIFDRYQKFEGSMDESSSLEHMKKLLKSLLNSFSEKLPENTLDLKSYISKEREDWPQLLFLLTRRSLGLRSSDIAISSCSTLTQMENIASEIIILASVSDVSHYFRSLIHLLPLS